MPDTLSTDYRYEGKEGQSPMDITEKMTKGKVMYAPDIRTCQNSWVSMTGLGGLRNVPDDKLPSDDFRAFKAYMTKNWGRFSLWDGGCMMYLVCSIQLYRPKRNGYQADSSAQITIPDEGTVSSLTLD